MIHTTMMNLENIRPVERSQTQKLYCKVGVGFTYRNAQKRQYGARRWIKTLQELGRRGMRSNLVLFCVVKRSETDYGDEWATL